MIIKLPFKNHLNHRLPLYLISLVVVPIVVSSLVILRTNPKKTERYSLFVGAYLDPNGSLKNKIKTLLGYWGLYSIDVIGVSILFNWIVKLWLQEEAV